jgi:hypothetical protein
MGLVNHRLTLALGTIEHPTALHRVARRLHILRVRRWAIGFRGDSATIAKAMASGCGRARWNEAADADPYR